MPRIGAVGGVYYEKAPTWAVSMEGTKEMNKALKIGGIVVLVLALVAAGVMALRAANQPSAANNTPLASATVIRGSIEETVSATGNAGVEEQVALPFGTGGEITEVLVKAGQTVEAGPGSIQAGLRLVNLSLQG